MNAYAAAPFTDAKRPLVSNELQAALTESIINAKLGAPPWKSMFFNDAPRDEKRAAMPFYGTMKSIALVSNLSFISRFTAI